MKNQMRVTTVKENHSMIRDVLDQFKIQDMYNKAVHECPFVSSMCS